jgi:hypothetical protein
VTAYEPLQVEDTWYADPGIPHIDVPEHKASFTGILDARGEEIWRGPNPMGFGRHGEWA